MNLSLKCETRECPEPPVSVRPATPREQIELSTGKVPTDVFECCCGWKRMVPSCLGSTASPAAS